MNVSPGLIPCMNAAPYTKGLKVDPGWRRAWLTWSNCSDAKSRLPTQAFTAPLLGSSARNPACSERRSCPFFRRASASFCSCASCFATAVLAADCMRESRVVCTTSPSELMSYPCSSAHNASHRRSCFATWGAMPGPSTCRQKLRLSGCAESASTCDCASLPLTAICASTRLRRTSARSGCNTGL